MNEIIENTFIFIDDLEKSDLIKELTECKEILLKDNKVLNLIKEYNNLEDTNILLNLKKELYQNHTYQTIPPPKLYHRYLPVQKYDENPLPTLSNFRDFRHK